MRMHLMVEALAQAIEKASPAGQKPTAATGQDAIDLIAVAAQLERANVTLQGQNGTMRAADHQFQQPLVVGVMDRQGAPGVKFDVEGSGYGFRVIKTLPAASAEQATTCRMQRPG
jgi:branched-chain amino acid transport system substrate-binding protein